MRGQEADIDQTVNLGLALDPCAATSYFGTLGDLIALEPVLVCSGIVLSVKFQHQQSQANEGRWPTEPGPRWSPSVRRLLLSFVTDGSSGILRASLWQQSMGVYF